MAQELGVLKRVKVKDFWKHEAHDFTPWLALPENIGKLGEALGLELEVESLEVAVGPYAADILARTTGSDRYVVIENQFGKTNHDHLGKLLTYGAVLNAGTIVWIAEDFGEEHRKTLDWLNDHTDDGLDFYGVHLELWQIDDSRPAVQFNVVSEPTIKVGPGTPELTEAKQLQLDYWTQFADRIVKAKIVAKAHTPSPKYWFNVPIGRAGFYVSNFVNTTHQRIGIRLIIDAKNPVEAFKQLDSQRTVIEAEIGVNLVWDAPSGKPGGWGVIRLVRQDCDISKKDHWPTYLDWMVDMTCRFKKAFAPRVKQLVLSVPEAVIDPDEVDN